MEVLTWQSSRGKESLTLLVPRIPDVVAGKGAQVIKVVVNNNGCGSGCLKAIGYLIVGFFVLGVIGSIIGDHEDSPPPSRIEQSR